MLLFTHIVCLLQALSSSIHYGLLFILPAYCLTPYASGGMNYNLVDLGLVMSTTGFLLYGISVLTMQPKCYKLLKLYPVRAMR